MSDDVVKQDKGGPPSGFWLEVYKDMFRPAARVAGEVLEDFARTLNRSGLEFGADGREHVRRLIVRARIAIPDAQLVLPPPPILGRVVESIRFEPEGTPLYEIFEQLLSASMDSERVHLVHPSFPVLLGHLCSDEVRLLEHLRNEDVFGPWSRWVPLDQLHPEYPTVPSGLLQRPQSHDLYYANLSSLSLVTYSDEMEQWPSANLYRQRWKLTLQGMGRHLMAACRKPAEPQGTAAA